MWLIFLFKSKLKLGLSMMAPLKFWIQVVVTHKFMEIVFWHNWVIIHVLVIVASMKAEIWSRNLPNSKTQLVRWIWIQVCPENQNWFAPNHCLKSVNGTTDGLNLSKWTYLSEVISNSITCDNWKVIAKYHIVPLFIFVIVVVKNSF